MLLWPDAANWVPGERVSFVAVHDEQSVIGTLVLPSCMARGEFQGPFSLHPHLPLTHDKNCSAPHGMLALAIFSGFDEDYFSDHDGLDTAFQAEYTSVLRYAEEYFEERIAHGGVVCCVATVVQTDKHKLDEARRTAINLGGETHEEWVRAQVDFYEKRAQRLCAAPHQHMI
jgi:hypothetical protein